MLLHVRVNFLVIRRCKATELGLWLLHLNLASAWTDGDGLTVMIEITSCFCFIAMLPRFGDRKFQRRKTLFCSLVLGVRFCGAAFHYFNDNVSRGEIFIIVWVIGNR